MPLFWYLAGMLSALALLALGSPWLRTASRFTAFTRTPARAVMTAGALVAAIFGLYEGLGTPRSAAPALPAIADMQRAPQDGTGSFATAAKTFDSATGGALASGNPAAAASPTVKANAGSMDDAIKNLEGRLAKGGGSDGDWELLAKSFDFLGRPEEAAKARAHQLPPGDGMVKAAAATGVAVSGEVTLDAALKDKAKPGETIFIVAKSVASPGIPVAVFRGTVTQWPLKFMLDDSQSMMPGRNLSTAGKVTIEARISKQGQPLPAAGDLQGSSGAIDPANAKPLKITIDREIS